MPPIRQSIRRGVARRGGLRPVRHTCEQPRAQRGAGATNYAFALRKTRAASRIPGKAVHYGAGVLRLLQLRLQLGVFRFRLVEDGNIGVGGLFRQENIAAETAQFGRAAFAVHSEWRSAGTGTRAAQNLFAPATLHATGQATEQVRASTHFSGKRLNQDLSRYRSQSLVQNTQPFFRLWPEFSVSIFFIASAASVPTE
jgi:hypothetical protein